MIKTKDFRQFTWKTFLIKEVYNPYFDGWLDNLTKKTHRTFKKFPVSLEEVLVNGSPEIDEVKKLSMDKTELREQIWNNNSRQFEFHKVKDKIDRDFYKTWKKVFDLVIEFEDMVEVETWKDWWNVKVKDKDVQITVVWAWKIKWMITSLVDELPPMIDWKDKAGNPAKIPEYDYEDKMKEQLKWKFVKMKVTGEWLDTKYVFNEWKEFNVTENNIKTEKNPLKQDEIDMDDLPF